MSESIYRFISFENFVDTVQRKALCFVHPSVFDDPLEFQYLQSYSLKNAKHRIEILAKMSQINRMFVQSWTKLSESDALWRIYKYNTFSVRIEIDLKDIELLDDVNSADVIYTDTPNDIIDQYASQNGISAVRQMAIKRTAFSHEQEVRLIHHERWDDEDDGLNNCYFRTIHHPTQSLHIFCISIFCTVCSAHHARCALRTLGRNCVSSKLWLSGLCCNHRI